VSLVEQELPILPEHLSSPPVFSGVRVTRSVVLRVCFVDRCLSFCPFSFGHCVVCSSSVYGFFKLFLGPTLDICVATSCQPNMWWTFNCPNIRHICSNKLPTKYVVYNILAIYFAILYFPPAKSLPTTRILISKQKHGYSWINANAQEELEWPWIDSINMIAMYTQICHGLLDIQSNLY